MVARAFVTALVAVAAFGRLTDTYGANCGQSLSAARIEQLAAPLQQGREDLRRRLNALNDEQLVVSK